MKPEDIESFAESLYNDLLDYDPKDEWKRLSAMPEFPIEGVLLTWGKEEIK